MNSFKKILSVVGLVFVFFIAGFFSGRYFRPAPPPAGEVVLGPVYQNIIKKNISKMPEAEKDAALKCFHESDFILDIKQKDNSNSYVAYSALCGRQVNREFMIPVSESGNWKLYAGITLGGVLVAGGIYGGYKLIKATR